MKKVDKSSAAVTVSSGYLFLAASVVMAVVAAITLAIMLSKRRAVTWGASLVSSARLVNKMSAERLCSGFPFKRVVNEAGAFVGAAIGAPFRDARTQERALELRARGVPLIGFCHYQNFPGSLRHNKFEDTFHYSHPLDYVSLMTAWGTCFRDPVEHGLTPQGPPVIDLVESDFAEPMQPVSATRTYDFAYLCLSDAWNSCDNGWQAYCRNWQRAKRVMDLVCARGYRGVLFGRAVCAPDELPSHLHARTVRFGMLHQAEFWRTLAACRCLFVPNRYDASPRVIAEAIQLEVGVLVNAQILGGWKYVDSTNGALFDPELNDDKVAEQLIGLIERQKRAAFSNRSFRERYGRLNTGARLARFLNPLLRASHERIFLNPAPQSV